MDIDPPGRPGTSGSQQTGTYLTVPTRIIPGPMVRPETIEERAAATGLSTLEKTEYEKRQDEVARVQDVFNIYSQFLGEITDNLDVNEYNASIKALLETTHASILP